MWSLCARRLRLSEDARCERPSPAGHFLTVHPFGVAVEPSGTILVIDRDAGTGFQGALFRVDPLSGARTLLSDFGSGPNPGFYPVGVAVVPDTTPPDTSLTSTPPNPDTRTSPSFGFSGTDDATPPPASASNAGSMGRASAPAPVPKPIPA